VIIAPPASAALTANTGDDFLGIAASVADVASGVPALGAAVVTRLSPVVASHWGHVAEDDGISPAHCGQ
jgi:hypothetical protein